MYKIDKIKGLFDCDICNNLLVDPISLPCGNNVCNQHLEHFVLEKSFVCESCNGKHHVPEEGHFIVNKQIKKALDIDLNNLKVSFSAYNECKVRIEEAKESLEQIEALERNAESHIYEYFGSIKRQVDIRREKLKAEIDDYSDSLIKSLDTAQTEFIRLSNEENELSKNIKAFKKQLDEITGKFDKLEFDDKKFKSMKQSLDVLNKNLIQTIYSYNDNLIDNKNYDFVFEQKSISSIFGRLFEIKLDSRILNSNLKSQLSEICELNHYPKWELLYRATRDGFGAKDFHQKCDNFKNTLVVIKSTSGNIFGGFTSKPWNSISTVDSQNNHVSDPSSYIFSLVNQNEKPFKALAQSFYSGIFCDTSKGPEFGEMTSNGIQQFDLSILSDSNIRGKTNSFSSFGNGYTFSDHFAGTYKAKTILAGTHKFVNVEIEVYRGNFF